MSLGELSKSVSRTFHYAFRDWTREMPKSRRLLTWAGMIIQGYAIYALGTGSLAWPLLWPKGALLYVSVCLLYLFGYCIINWALTWELVRKTQLEADQIAGRQIQQTLQPESFGKLPGYQVEAFYKPFREVGGDYFDVIELPHNRVLFAFADVSGKGMPAALLASNIQALVRTIAIDTADPVSLAIKINKHLSRHTPTNRFATAVFIVLSCDSGELTYVNAGHNPPIVSCCGSTTFLNATGLPLGLFAGTDYKADNAVLGYGGALLLFTDGLTDSISGNDPESLLCNALADVSASTMANLRSLVDPNFYQDDVTILLVKRAAGSASSAVAAEDSPTAGDKRE